MLPNAYGYDISKFCLDFAKTKWIKIIGDIKKIKNESYEIIFSCHVLEHIENPFETLKLLWKKLKKDGKLILVLPIERNKKNFNLDHCQHLYCWNFRTINNLLIKTGFQPIENTILRGNCYKKLLPLNKINFNIYKFLTEFAGFLTNSKEMKIIAVKK